MKGLTPAKVTMIMFFVVGGLVLAYMGKRMFAVEEKKVEVRYRNLPMPIADIPAGTQIKEEHLGLGPMLQSDLQRDMLLVNRVIVGRITKELLPAAQPIRSNQLYEPGVHPPLKIGKGMRAITIEARGASSIVDGLIKPGEFVDIHFTPTNFNDPRITSGLTMTMLKGVKILAINKLMLQGNVEDDRNSVTLELTPEQANVMILANERGMITMSYNPNGKGDGHLALRDKDRVTLEEILKLPPIEKPAPPTPPFMSQIFRGSGRQDLQFKDNRVADPTSQFYQNPAQPQVQQQSNPTVPNPPTPNQANPAAPPVPAPTAPFDNNRPQNPNPHGGFGPNGPNAPNGPGGPSATRQGVPSEFERFGHMLGPKV